VGEQTGRGGYRLSNLLGCEGGRLDLSAFVHDVQLTGTKPEQAPDRLISILKSLDSSSFGGCLISNSSVHRLAGANSQNLTRSASGMCVRLQIYVYIFDVSLYICTCVRMHV